MKYIVHKDGKVYSHRVLVSGKVKRKPIPGTPSDRGYLTANFHGKSGRRFARLHRLVAKGYLPNPDNKPDINHLNGVKTDNRLVNIEWCTKSENCLHLWETGLRKRTGCICQDKDGWKAVIMIRGKRYQFHSVNRPPCERFIQEILDVEGTQ